MNPHCTVNLNFPRVSVNLCYLLTESGRVSKESVLQAEPTSGGWTQLPRGTASVHWGASEFQQAGVDPPLLPHHLQVRDMSTNSSGKEKIVLCVFSELTLIMFSGWLGKRSSRRLTWTGCITPSSLHVWRVTLLSPSSLFKQPGATCTWPRSKSPFTSLTKCTLPQPVFICAAAGLWCPYMNPHVSYTRACYVSGLRNRILLIFWFQKLR